MHILVNVKMRWIKCNLRYVGVGFHVATTLTPRLSNNIPSEIARSVTWINNNLVPWWRHQMGTFSALLAICAVPGEFFAQRPVTRTFDVFFDLRLNKGLSKQSWGWWFEMLSCPLWRHCNADIHKSPGISLTLDLTAASKLHNYSNSLKTLVIICDWLFYHRTSLLSMAQICYAKYAWHAVFRNDLIRAVTGHYTRSSPFGWPRLGLATVTTVNGAHTHITTSMTRLVYSMSWFSPRHEAVRWTTMMCFCGHTLC